MRLKGKHVTLGLLANSSSNVIREPAQHVPAVASAGHPPFRLVPVVTSNPAEQRPAAQQASAGAQHPQAPSAAAAALPLDRQQEAWSPALSQVIIISPPQAGQEASVPPLAQQHLQLQQQQPGPLAPNASGRPARKRKATSYAEDMLPTDAALGRGGKARGALPRPGPTMPLSAVQLSAFPPGMRPAAVAGVAGAPGAGMPPALQLVTVPTAHGGTRVGLALPAAALVAMPQLLRMQGHGALSSPTLHGAMQTGAVMPYKLVAPGGQWPPAAAAGGKGSGDAASDSQPSPQQQQQQQEVPAVATAAPRDVTALAKLIQEEERRRALAVAAGAQAALRALPGAPQAGRGSRAAAGKLHATSSRGGGGGGRGRSGSRTPKRVPSDAWEHSKPTALPPGTWHPGFSSVGGMTHVSVEQSPSALPLPAVVAGVPPRVGEAMVQERQPEHGLSADSLRGALDFLHHAARTAGDAPPAYGSQAAAAGGAEQAAHTDVLARAVYARDGRRVAAQVEATRKSTRTRSAPATFEAGTAMLAVEQAAAQRQQQQQSSRGAKAKRRTPSPEDKTDVRLGTEHQAVLPAAQPRPAGPTAEEARWIEGLVVRAGGVPPLPPLDRHKTAAMPAASAEDRAAWVAGAHDALHGALGDELAAALGLLAMGAGPRAGRLSDEEEAAFEEGMRELGRDFRAIQREYVPGRTVYDLQNHYYNVWKLRASQRSKAWYERREAEEAAQLAEEARREAAAAAEQEAARQRQEQRQKQRMLREVVSFIRGAACAPEEAAIRPTLVQRAQRAVKLVGSLNAGAGSA